MKNLILNGLRLLGISTLALIATACEPEQPDPTLTADETKLLELVNNVRATGCDCGGEAMPAVGAVVWNDTLELAAQGHSDDMKTNNYFSHTGLDGSTPGDRITAVGYNWFTYGENIAQGYTTPEEVIQGWLESEGHCRNIMDGDFKEMGVAVSGTYWTQVFGAK